MEPGLMCKSSWDKSLFFYGCCRCYWGCCRCRLPSQLHDSVGRHHDARSAPSDPPSTTTKLTSRLMQHNCACMFVVPHLSLYFLHRSVWFLPSRRAGHHVASPVIWCLVAMRLHTLLCSSQHFLILLRLSSCCGEKESTNRHLDPCYLCTVFSTCFHIFFAMWMLYTL